MAASYGLSTLINDSSLKCFLDASNPNSYDGRENLLTFSGDLTNAVWTKVFATIGRLAAEGPDGTISADTMTAATQCIAYQTLTVSNNTIHTQSVYVKNISNVTTITFGCDTQLATVTFSFSSNTITSVQNDIISYRVDNAGNGWYRIAIAFTTTSTSPSFILRNNTPSGTGVTAWWGAQMERGNYAGNVVLPMAYVPTTSSAISRTLTWTDLSGNGKNITWSNTISQFAVSNNATRGIPHFRTIFNAGVGANSNTFGITNTTGYTIFMGFMESGVSGTFGFTFQDVSAARGIFAHLVYSDGNLYFDQGGCCGGDTRVVSPFTETYTKFNVVTLRRSAVERSIFKNGTQLAQNITESAASINLSSVTMGIGTYSDWQGMVNMFMVYNRALSNAEIARVAAGFKSRYGVT